MPPKRGLNHEAVIHAAVELADKQGLESVTLASVAAQLGIRIPSLYNHVSGLAGLQRGMALYGVHQLTEALRRAATGKAKADAIRAMAVVYRSFALTHPGLYRTLLRAPSEEETDLAEASAELLNVILDVLAAYDLESDRALHMVRIFRSMMHGFVDLEIAGGFAMALDTDDTFNQLIDILIKGLP
ncbi:MAG: WHG domain-containing protein [Chloroflexota bacterium]